MSLEWDVWMCGEEDEEKDMKGMMMIWKIEKDLYQVSLVALLWNVLYEDFPGDTHTKQLVSMNGNMMLVNYKWGACWMGRRYRVHIFSHLKQTEVCDDVFCRRRFTLEPKNGSRHPVDFNFLISLQKCHMLTAALKTFFHVRRITMTVEHERGR